ncbi:hypothetical protein GH810_14345 [Acetobacterium paludosum]|uniref:Uncharacterized protein n=1 Tax=Acetobacterium paludosum TaxID=52693 RepID=A0A923KTJ4_9FIRM|nr:hypothetical protein [Acetobacterium paludosum]MBC3889492.1 hypothetical protein [Acetobacterium paludosum]
MEQIDLSKYYQPYFLAYINHLGLKAGDQCDLILYTQWIMKKHEEFRKLQRMNENKPYTDDEREMFIEYIGEVEE